MAIQGNLVDNKGTADTSDDSVRVSSNNSSANIASGNVPGKSIMMALGERENVGTTATGEDIWRGAATSTPTPADVGEQMTLVSDDVQDTTLGTGVRRVRIDYIDAAGDEQTETVDLDGTTPVDTVATDIRFVNDMYTVLVGSNGVAEGEIIIYKKGAASTIYNMIAEGGNKSLVPHRMVPAGKCLILQGWHATEAQGRRQTLRIRSTDMNGTLLPGVFCFKGVAYLNKTTTGELKLNVSIPALSIVKVSSWAVVAGGETSCSWWGVLCDE